MRIISGKFKARRFMPPASLQARPTTDFAKEGLFNLLVNRLDLGDIDALDLFSGSGSISFEFASRGARKVISIEQNPRNLSYIKKVSEELKLEHHLCIKADAFKYGKSCSEQFEIVFADPPYDLKELPKVPDLIFDNQLLKKDGLLILEHGKTHGFAEHPHFIEERNYGNVHFSFFK